MLELEVDGLDPRLDCSRHALGLLNWVSGLAIQRCVLCQYAVQSQMLDSRCRILK